MHLFFHLWNVCWVNDVTKLHGTKHIIYMNLTTASQNKYRTNLKTEKKCKYVDPIKGYEVEIFLLSTIFRNVRPLLSTVHVYIEFLPLQY